jgi:hypothetical protein
MSFSIDGVGLRGGAAGLPGLAPLAQGGSRGRGAGEGTLIIAGGGKLGPEIVGRFIALAGGPGANIVVIPTAGEDAAYGPDCDLPEDVQALGATHLTVLHTKDRQEADSEAFVSPLKSATAVWFVGGRNGAWLIPTWGPAPRLRSSRSWPAAAWSAAPRPARRSRRPTWCAARARGTRS